MQTTIPTINEKQMPDSFTTLLGAFARIPSDKKGQSNQPRQEYQPNTVREYIAHKLADKYPLLDPSASKAQRRTSIPIGGDSKFAKNIRNFFHQDLNRLNTIGYNRNHNGHVDFSVYDPNDPPLKDLATENVEFPTPDSMTLNMPLFAITDKEEYSTTGIISHNIPLKWQCHFRDRDREIKDQSYIEVQKFRFRCPIDLKAQTPVTPEAVQNAIPQAFADYYAAVAEAVTNLKTKSHTEIQPAKTEILWVPKPDVFEMQAPECTPEYTDPALLMTAGDDRYVIGLWDSGLEEAVDIETTMREWTKGSFKGVKGVKGFEKKFL